MRQIAVLIGVLLVALIFNSFIPKAAQGQQLDRTTIERFIIEDAKTSYGETSKYNVVKYSETDGKYDVELDITINYTPQPGSNQVCSKTNRRYYTLFPIAFREEAYGNTCN
jgi:hypothetical protein